MGDLTREECAELFGLMMAACERKNDERRRTKRELWSMAADSAAESLKAVVPSAKP